MKNFSKSRPKLPSKKKKKIEESKSMPRRERLLSTSKSRRRLKDSLTNRILDRL